MKAADIETSLSRVANPRKPVVLVVDDFVEMLRILGSELSEEGYTVLTASSAAEACEQVRRQKPDLVLLDWHLKGASGAPDEPCSGSDVLNVCREIDLLLPVIVMSGSDRFDVRSDSLAKTADSFLQKPFGVNLIKHHVRFLLERQQRAKSLFHLESYSDIVPMDEMKYLYARSVVAFVGGSISEAARRLHVSRGTLSELLKRFKEDKPSSSEESGILEDAA